MTMSCKKREICPRLCAGRVAIAESCCRIRYAEERKRTRGRARNAKGTRNAGKEKFGTAARREAERSGARKAVARGRKARGGKGRRPRGRRRLTDRRRSRGERARLRGIPGRARAVPPEARRFQSFARDDEPRTSRVRETRSCFAQYDRPIRTEYTEYNEEAQPRGKRKGGGGEGWPQLSAGRPLRDLGARDTWRLLRE